MNEEDRPKNDLLRHVRRVATAARSRRFIVVVAGLIIAAAIPFVARGAPDRKVLVAHEFVLLGNDGRTRARLTMARETAFGPGLVLFDTNGKVRARLALTEEGPEMILTDRNEKIRARLALNDSGARLVLNDENENRRALLIATEAGPSLSLLDENQILRARLLVTESTGGLTLYDQEGKPLFSRPRGWGRE